MGKKEIPKKCIAEIEYTDRKHGSKYNIASQMFPFRTPEDLCLQINNILCGNLREIVRLKIVQCIPPDLCVCENPKNSLGVVINKIHERVGLCLKCQENLISINIAQDEDGKKISSDKLRDIEWISQKLIELTPETISFRSRILSKLKRIFVN